MQKPCQSRQEFPNFFKFKDIGACIRRILIMRKRRSMRRWIVDQEIREGNKPNDYSELCELGRDVSHFATQVAF